MEEFVQYICAVLAIVAATGALTVAAVSRFARSSQTRRMAELVLRYRIEITAAIGVVATLGSLYFSEVADMVPCRMCWFQRVFMYPIGVIAVVASFRRDRQARWYLVTLAAFGLMISTYHNLIELRPELETGTCALFGPACSVVYFRAFGLSLATMAWLGFAAVLIINMVNPPTKE